MKQVSRAPAAAGANSERQNGPSKFSARWTFDASAAQNRTQNKQQQNSRFLNSTERSFQSQKRPFYFLQRMAKPPVCRRTLRSSQRDMQPVRSESRPAVSPIAAMRKKRSPVTKTPELKSRSPSGASPPSRAGPRPERASRLLPRSWAPAWGRLAFPAPHCALPRGRAARGSASSRRQAGVIYTAGRSL